MAPAEDTRLSLKLLIDKSTQKVLFAEAGKEFVDILFYLLALPLGTVTGHLSLGNLYESIESLSQTYFLPSKYKDFLLRPYAPALIQSPLLLSNEAQHAAISSNKKFYFCSGCKKCISDDPSVICPTYHQDPPSFFSPHHSDFNTGRRMINTEVRYIAPATSSSSSSSSDEGGLVKGMVTYMVMDNLVVKPMSTISTITLLKKFNVKDVGDLEEKVVDFAMAEGLKLVKASMQSKSVLTSVFLGNTQA